MKLMTMTCTEVRPNYDSTWRVKFEDGKSVKLTRTDEETEDHLRELVAKCETIAQVANLNMRDQIYYD